MDNVLLREGDEGWVLPLIQVTRAGFVQHKARGAMMWRLDLWQGDTMRRLSYTGAVTTWQEDPPGGGRW